LPYARRLFLVLLFLATPFSAVAQDARRTATCDGKIVSAIAIVARDPSFVRVPRPLRGLARGVGLHHTTTKAAVIGRFLLLEAGRPCTERQRAESERILRFQPFLAGATVSAVPDTTGGVRIEVETIDEIPTVLDVRFKHGRPAELRVGNANVGGRGVYVDARGERGFAYRTGVGARLVAHQAFGRPYTLGVVADRAPLGGTVSVALSHAFITDLQRTAWHFGFDDLHRYTSFARPDSGALALGARRRFAAAGGVLRIGHRRPGAFVGGLLTHERVVPAARAVVVSDSGLVADSSAQLGGPFASVHNVRLNAVIGVRSIAFMAVRGFDALSAAQDVATGVQVGAVVGRGVSWFGTGDDDVFLAGDLYAGVGSATSFAALRVEGEARHDRNSDRWDSVIGSGRLAWYFKPSAAQILIGSAEFSGGWRWRHRMPFQLMLGDRHAGVRGYGDSRVAGSVRTVGRLEARRVIGRLTRHVLVGLATFADAGRVWAGDAPFGIDSKTKMGVGLGLLAAIPPHSRRLWRLDVAVPLSVDTHAGWALRLTAIRASGFWREPNDVTRGRAGAAPATIFTWP
jgi:hypothetical protein